MDFLQNPRFLFHGVEIFKISLPLDKKIIHESHPQKLAIFSPKNSPGHELGEGKECFRSPGYSFSFTEESFTSRKEAY